MTFLLKVKQYEKIYDIGGFESEESIYKFIESIPFTKKEIISNDCINYFMEFEDIPDYYELNYNNYLYVFSKFSFKSSEHNIYFIWSKIHLWDKKVAMKETFIEGKIIIDNYSFSNNEVKNYITKRGELDKESKKSYEKKRLKVSKNFIKPEDERNLELIDGSMIYILDSSIIDVWRQSKSIDEFIDKSKKFLGKT
ncbi:hypothetical protein P5E93_15530 [Clostridium perfringens]|nr:hypothetical protein [Clostridium perfringens]